MHYAKYDGFRTRHPNRADRKKFPPTAARFREARQALRLTVDDCANQLRVSDRTIRGWESGLTRVPYAAYKLMRVLKGGRYLAHPYWRDFIARGPILITPEGHQLHAGDLAWLSLLVRRARAFGDLMKAARPMSPAPKAQPTSERLDSHPSPDHASDHSGTVDETQIAGVDSEALIARAAWPAAADHLQSVESGTSCSDKSPELGVNDVTSKSLKTKRIPSESLSLTSQFRSQSGQSPQSKTVRQQDKAVRP